MSATIKVLTYNTHLFGSSPGGSVGGLVSGIKNFLSKADLVVFDDDGRRHDIQTRLHRLAPDIIGLTEVWDRDHAGTFTGGLRASHPYAATDGSSSGQGSGLLLLSRHPLSQARFVGFRTLSGSDKMASKGFIVATVAVGGTDLRVVLTHTQADEDAAARAARADNFRQIIDELRQAEGPCLLMGDFNVIGEAGDGSPTQEYCQVNRDLSGLGMADLFRTVHGDTRQQPGFTYDATIANTLIAKFSDKDFQARSRQRLDYVYARDCRAMAATVPIEDFIRSTARGPEPLSDHDPLLVELSVGPG